MSDSGFRLDPQLAKGTINLGDLALSRVLLVDDSSFPWLMLVPRRPDVSEIIDLGDIERAHLMTEITQVAEALKAETGCDKLNIAALGNVVAQLHVHVIARFRGDPVWPRPVWGVMAPTPYDNESRADAVSRLRRRIWLQP